MSSDLHLANKRFVHAALARLAEAAPGQIETVLGEVYAPDAEWRGAHPLNEMRGVEAIARLVWGPLKAAFPDLERRDDLIIAGGYGGADFVGAVGAYLGVFRGDWLSIPATGAPIYIRYGEMHRVEGGRIVQSSVLLDILDVIRQAGFQAVAPSLGVEQLWPAPLGAAGVNLAAASDPAQSQASIAQTLAMQATLGAYNNQERDGRDGLLNMPQKDYWHPKMMWYGPCGIGTTRSLQGFVDYHQMPFRLAFKERLGGQHYVRIGDGAFSATGGWPSVTTRHEGGGFMGLSPTGRPVSMRVMDFYHHHEGLIRENWVPLDILHLLLQMDVDVLGRMRSFFRRGADS